MTLQVSLFEADSPPRKAPRGAPDEQLNEGFSVENFVANFEALASAAGGAAGLRRLILDLAVRGRLTSPTAVRQAANGPFPIPEHWAWGRGDDVFAFVTSGSRGWAAYYAADGPLFLRIGNLDYETTDLDLRNIQHVRPPKNAEGVRTRVEAGDILISITGDTGMVGLAPPNLGEAYINQHIALARPAANVWPAFVARALTAPSLLGRLQSAQRGIKNSLGLEDVRGLAVPLPPLAEQKRIVARVDQLMALIDDLEAKQTKKRDLSTRFTKASLEALTTADSPEAFDTAWQRVVANFAAVVDRTDMVAELRAALLQLAVSGGLSAQGREHWQRATIADVADCRLGKMLDKAKNRGTPRGYLRNTNVHWFRLELDSIKEMRFEDDELDEYELRPGDLVVCEGGHGIGRTAVWQGELQSMMFQKALHRLRPKATMDSHFLAYQMKVAADTGAMRQYFTGAGIPHLTGRRLAEMPVNVPPLVEQKRIVAKVEHLMKLCDDLEAKLRRAEDRVSKLVEAVVQEMVA